MHRIISGDEYSHFELAEDLTSHHHHLVCTSCGRVADVTLSDDIEASLDRGARRRGATAQGFQPEHHRLDVIGRCAACVSIATRADQSVTGVPSSASSPGCTTEVTPGTRSFMIRSMPAFIVTVEAGQLTHGAVQLDGHDAGVVVDPDQRDVTTVGLDGRADDLDDLFDLGQFHLGLHAVLSARSVGDDADAGSDDAAPMRHVTTRPGSVVFRMDPIVGRSGVARPCSPTRAAGTRC